MIQVGVFRGSKAQGGLRALGLGFSGLALVLLGC